MPKPLLSLCLLAYLHCGTPTELLKKVTQHGIEEFTKPTSIGKLLTNRSKLPVDQVTCLGNKNGKRTYLINLREEE